MGDPPLIRWFEDLGRGDVEQVGGKNAALGEMIHALQREGIRVPGGFATTASAYWRYIRHNNLGERIRAQLARLERGTPLNVVGAAIRKDIRSGEYPPGLADHIVRAYEELCARHRRDDLDVAVRSSATAEDLPHASFAGQQESFLNIRGEQALLDACRRCFASLFTDRAIAYRQRHGFDHLKVALSVGVQRMVRSDLACAGVAFSIDTETGFPHLVMIDAAWGLGETVVQGTTEPDEIHLFKPFLERRGIDPFLTRRIGHKDHKVVYTDDPSRPVTTIPTTEAERRALCLTHEEALQIARWTTRIERHYGAPMDIEWAKDGLTGELAIVQARPETVQSRKASGTLESFELLEEGPLLAEGLAVGQGIATGPPRVIRDMDQAEGFRPGSVLVTEMTDPDWLPLMRRAAAIVTDHGGRTSHAAIVSRELGIPAVVGTGDATRVLEREGTVTVDTASSERGRVLDGELHFERHELDTTKLPETETRIFINIGSPAGALRWWRLPVQGIGLARMEYLINNVIQVHPMALVHFDQVRDPAERARIEALTRNHPDKRSYFIDTLARGIATMAASRHPDPVIVRTSDFKTNEYARLLGGAPFEPHEENPMLGWRGASRYHDPGYRAGFAMECEALRRAREDMGFNNVVVMIPFCRTLEEADRVLATMAEHGLERGRHGLEILVMAEVPSNVLLASAFAQRFDGFSIGSNDLTQLVLGVSRDEEKLGHLFDERDPAVLRMIRELVYQADFEGAPVGLCGQAPSDHPSFARFLVEAGLTSISVNPDSVARVIAHVAEAEKDRAKRASRLATAPDRPQTWA